MKGADCSGSRRFLVEKSFNGCGPRLPMIASRRRIASTRLLHWRHAIALSMRPMRQVKRSALIPFSPAQMFALVADIERYPEFVPWVARSQVIQRSDTEVVGRLEMNRAGLRETFTTRNVMTPPGRMELHLVEGPFKTLEGVWTFDPLGARGTKIGLSMQFEFSNPVTALLLSRSFENSCGELVDAFVNRARMIYSTL
jgi:ribosome-associated toxin RatA of RatAB toxin-antitoxin module